MSKNLKSKTVIRLKHFVHGRTHICLLAIVKVTYVAQCYDIKSSTFCGKVLKKKRDTQIKWYFIFSDHGCWCFLIK